MRAIACGVGILAALLGGCGGVEVDTQGADPLRLLDLSPRLGETGVAPDAQVVAVFSTEVILGTGEGELYEDTFHLEGAAGAPVAGSLELSALDEELATVVFSPDSPLAAGSYTVVIADSLQGRTDGGRTDPLGVTIRSGFEVGP
ncbi:MAG TPA: Ig-like domain-containing protein [Myxococcota bacterium]|nr:Ig-like domain-containing protein [Myxococcota bacterium]HRY92623.1 Ig-like domain-containing protein [Myxococcota bacterium]HSA23495.1 Ig-like domain-containing protein [Myxococcota bacterium]